MKKLIVVAIVLFLAWHQYGKYREEAVLRVQASDTPPSEPAAFPRKPVSAPGNSFKCDGRIYCSQMTSCEEATFFLKNCPGVKMDGNNDGVPCEQQWCR
jgi:excalibur calcium-binding domain-containing protein